MTIVHICDLFPINPHRRASTSTPATERERGTLVCAHREQGWRAGVGADRGPDLTDALNELGIVLRHFADVSVESAVEIGCGRDWRCR